MIPTYIINLDKDTSRWEKMKIECKKHFIENYTRIPGIDGSVITDKDMDLVSSSCKNFCTRSTIGCALSHIKAWEKVGGTTLILEDDSRFENDFVESVLSKLESVPKDFDILYLGCNIGCYNDDKRTFETFLYSLIKKTSKFKRINKDIYVPYLPLALHGYILSKKGAKKLLDLVKHKKVNDHIDVHILENSSGLSIYASDPLLVYQLVENSNIATGYPVVINSIFEKYTNDFRIPYTYFLTCPILKIGFMEINLFVIVVSLLAVALHSKGVSTSKLSLIYFVFNVVELYKNPKNLSKPRFTD